MSLNSYIAKQFANPKGLGGDFISLIMNRQNRPLYDETIRLLALSDSDSVLDIGCGNGFVLSLLANQHKSTFVGIDPSKEIIETALRRNRKYVTNGQMTFSCQDVGSLSFRDASFSRAYTINTVYFWSDLKKPMSEIFSVLKPGGFFINTLYANETLARFSHTQHGYRHYDAQQLTKAGTDAGFTVKASPVLQGSAFCYIYQKAAME